MQLETPLWKRVVVWAAVLVGLILAAPNLFYSRVETHNDAASAIAKAEKLGGGCHARPNRCLGGLARMGTVWSGQPRA